VSSSRFLQGIISVAFALSLVVWGEIHDVFGAILLMWHVTIVKTLKLKLSFKPVFSLR
jgi:hypothetical protein